MVAPHAHPAQGPDALPALVLRAPSPSLAGVALFCALLEPGDEVLLVEGACPRLAPLAELVGAHPSTVRADALWSEIDARTRAVVIPRDDELLALVAETRVLPIVALAPGDALPSEHAIGVEGASLHVGGRVGVALREALVRHAALVRDAEDAR